MAALWNLVSRKFLIVLAPLLFVGIKAMVCQQTFIFPPEMYGIIAVYIVANVVQKVIVTWLQVRGGAPSDGAS